MIGGSILGRGREVFSSRHRVQTGPGIHSDPYQMCTTSSFLGSKAAGTWSWPLNPSGAEVKNAWSHTSTFQYPFIVWWSVKELNTHPIQTCFKWKVGLHTHTHTHTQYTSYIYTYISCHMRQFLVWLAIYDKIDKFNVILGRKDWTAPCPKNMRVYPKVSGLSHNEMYAYNNKHSLRSNKNGYGGKTC
jgi:hypothetical protein